jgi:hypothetical protein
MRPRRHIIGHGMSSGSPLLACPGLCSVKALDPKAPIVPYDREAPGELLHIDAKKLGRIVQPTPV